MRERVGRGTCRPRRVACGRVTLSPALSPEGERGKVTRPTPQNQKGAGVSASPPVSPSARLPIRETGALRRRQARSTTGKGRGAVRSNGRQASVGRSPGRGRLRRAAFPPRCPCDPILPCGAPASRSGHRDNMNPKDRFARWPRVGPVAQRLHFRRGCGCIFPALPEGAAAPLQPAPPGPKTGFASVASDPFTLPEGIGPFPVRLSSPARGPGMPSDACPFRSRKVDANIAFTVSRGGVPVPFHAVSRRHHHGPSRDKHLISLWFPAAASSACPMMLSRFSSRTKPRQTVTTCG